MIPEDDIITKYTDYLILSPLWQIDYIQKELNIRDLAGLTNNRIQAINVTDVHPVAQIVGSVSPGEKVVNLAGFLPAISVGDDTDIIDDKAQTLGYGKQNGFIINQNWVDAIRGLHSDMETRIIEGGLLSDHQLDLIETAMNNSPQKAIVALQDMIRDKTESIISLWTQTQSDMHVLYPLLRSIVIEMRKSMSERGLTDIHYQANENFMVEFGEVVFGTEIFLDFLNTFTNVTVTNYVPTSTVLGKQDVEVIDLGTGNTFNIECALRPDFT